MHKVVLEAPKGMQVDHINRNSLDNRRINLRVVTPKQNAWGRGKAGHGVSQFKGVTKEAGKWRVRIYLNGRKTCLGYFTSERAAAIAYNDAARLHFGEFAFQNPI